MRRCNSDLFPHQLGVFDFDACVVFFFSSEKVFVWFFLFIWCRKNMINERSNSSPLYALEWLLIFCADGPFNAYVLSGLALCCVIFAAAQQPIEMSEYLPHFIINFRRAFFPATILYEVVYSFDLRACAWVCVCDCNKVAYTIHRYEWANCVD